MTHKNGIVGLLGSKVALQERIEAHLKRAPTGAALKDDYVDPTDRQNVRHRALIAAVLDACFEHGFPEDQTESVEIEVEHSQGIWSELATARRSFLRDVDLINAGANAQFIAKPTRTDGALSPKSVKAKKKDLILWLAVIHLHQKGLNSNFPTQQSVIDKAAKASGRAASSFPSELSKLTTGNGATKETTDYFWALVDQTQKLARAAGNEKDAFSLLLPAALAISTSLPRRGL